jgi:hypothetical protein
MCSGLLLRPMKTFALCKVREESNDMNESHAGQERCEARSSQGGFLELEAN